MGGGLMQLVAYGAQDIYLTGNPQITFFKVVYRRHTNFSMETIQQTISGSSTGTSGSGTVTISRNGDLINRMYVNAATGTCTKGSDIVSEAELEIGGQLIDRHWKEWNNIWNELSTPESKALGLKAMQCDIGSSSTAVSTIQIPLNFWFCRNPGLALPLIALQYHEVKVKFTWGGSNNGGVSVLVDYIYLDTDERRRFAQVSHEYLIEQIQKVSATAQTTTKLNFNHPVKELIWTGSDYGKAHLKLNGHDRFMKLEEEYFQLRQPFDHHTAVPKQNLPTAAQLTTLDRQTEFGLGAYGGSTGAFGNELTAAGTSGTSLTATTAASGKFMYTTVSGSRELSLDPTNDFTSDTTAAAVDWVGKQLAIVITVAGTSNIEEKIAGATASTAIVGRIYFTTITSVKLAEADVLVFGVTPPTSADGANAVLDTADTGTGKVIIYEVTNGNSAQARTSQMTEKINVYSFGLKPEEHQPSGTCNFSRIDTAQLVTDSNLTGNVYAVNYNVLRIMSGMGGLAYSN